MAPMVGGLVREHDGRRTDRNWVRCLKCGPKSKTSSKAKDDVDFRRVLIRVRHAQGLLVFLACFRFAFLSWLLDSGKQFDCDVFAWQNDVQRAHGTSRAHHLDRSLFRGKVLADLPESGTYGAPVYAESVGKFTSFIINPIDTTVYMNI